MATEKLVNLEGLSLFAQGIKKYIDERVKENDERFLTKNDLNDVIDMVDEDGYEIEVIRNKLDRTTERTSTLEGRADKLDKYTGMPANGLPSGQKNLTVRAKDLEDFTGIIGSNASKSLDERASSLESRATKVEVYTGTPLYGLEAGQKNLTQRTESLEDRATKVEDRATKLERYTGIEASYFKTLNERAKALETYTGISETGLKECTDKNKTLDGRLDFIEPMLEEHEHTIHDTKNGLVDRVTSLEELAVTKEELDEFRDLWARLHSFSEEHGLIGKTYERTNVNVGTDKRMVANISSRVLNVANDGDLIVEYNVFMNKTEVDEINRKALSIYLKEDMVVERDWIESHVIEAADHNDKIGEIYAGSIDAYLLMNLPLERYYVMRNDAVANHVFFTKYPDIYPDEGGTGGVEITNTSIKFCRGIYSMDDDGGMSLKWTYVPADEIPTGYYSFRFVAKVKEI